MPLTNETVIQANEALVALIKSDKEEKYSIPKEVRLKLGRNFNKTIPVIKDLSSQVQAIIAKNGKKNAKGEYQIDRGSDGDKAYNIERQDLLNSLSEVESFETISVAELPEQVSIDLIALLLQTGMLAA